MNRYLVLLTLAAFAVSTAIPAAAFAEPELFEQKPSASAALTHDALMENPQSLAAKQETSVSVFRDPFTSEIVKPTELAETYFPPIAGLLTQWPCSGPVNDGYGDRDGGFHYGIDIMCGLGAPIVATAGGVVEVVEEGAGSWGTYVKINHGSGVSTMCAHMIAGSPTVQVGQLVNAGDLVGSVGTTGQHHRPALPLRGVGQRRTRGSGPLAAVTRVPAAEKTSAIDLSKRDLTLDLARVCCVLVVVGIHLLMVGVGFGPDGEIVVSRPLEAQPWFAPGTWAGQIMPLFFVVGGFASLTAWHSLRRRGGTGAEYVRKRILRLAQPALPLYVFYVVVLS